MIVRTKPLHQSSFTLIEMMVVMVIIVVLAGSLMAVSSVVMKGVRAKKTQAQIRALEVAFEQYKDDWGYYPQSGADPITMSSTFSGSIVNPQNNRSYIPFSDLDLNAGGILTDAFGNPLYYESPGTMNPMKFDLWSAGPDGLFGKAATTDPTDSQTQDANNSDDIASWKRLD